MMKQTWQILNLVTLGKGYRRSTYCSGNFSVGLKLFYQKKKKKKKRKKRKVKKEVPGLLISSFELLSSKCESFRSHYFGSMRAKIKRCYGNSYSIKYFI